MATYLFSENRELKNIQNGDVVVNDCEDNDCFITSCLLNAMRELILVDFRCKRTETNVEIYTAHFTRIQADTEPQSAPTTPVPMGSN